jgi:hypothetical protein
MSKHRIWLNAEELMNRLGMGPLDLEDYVLNSKLIAYNRNKTPYDIDYDLMNDEQLLAEYIEVNGKMERALFCHVRFRDRVNEFIFKIDDVLRFEKDPENYLSSTEVKEKLLNSNQRHRERCRALAEYLWETDQMMTIEDMINNDTINKIGCENKIPPYNEKTLRKWINDLCPDRSPGRRPKLK